MKPALETMAAIGAQGVELGVRGDGTSLHLPGRAQAAWGHMLGQLMADRALSSMTGWAVEWARSGLPQVSVGHRLAASLMATSMPPEAAEHLEPPWPAWSVVLPQPLLRATDPRGELVDVALAHVVWSAAGVLILGSGLDLAPVWSSPRQPPSALAEDWHDELVTEELADVDLRMLRMLGRLVLGIAAELSSPEERERAERARSKAAKRAAGRDGPPTAWTYVLGRSVAVDARGVVTDYIAGGGAPPSVQSLVRGHWKRQPHGPERSLRRWIHVEPYWRGPEDAPIVARQHRIASRLDDSEGEP